MNPRNPKKINDQTLFEQRNLEPDEVKLWQEIAKTVDQERYAKKPTNVGLANLKTHHSEKGIRNLSFSETKNTRKNLKHGDIPGLDRKGKRRLRRGKIHIERELDLHGLTQSKAKNALINFVEKSFIKELREVLVITGKGLTVNGHVGILRQSVPQWINEEPLRGWIKGFSYAAPMHGGDGALYLFLRKKR